jgi:hypothetical protein
MRQAAASCEKLRAAGIVLPAKPQSPAENLLAQQFVFFHTIFGNGFSSHRHLALLVHKEAANEIE